MAKSKKETGVSKYLTPDTVKIIIYSILGIFIILAIKKVIDDLFNNPLSDGLGKALGTASKAVISILNGCSTQTACSKINNGDECESNDDCMYSNSKCITTGEKEGTGGPFSLGCALYIGLIVYIFALIFGGITKFFMSVFGSKSDLAKQAATLEGKTYDEVSKDISDKTKEDLPKVEEEFKTKNNREMTFKEKVYSVLEIAKRRVSDTIKKAIDNITDSQKKAEENAKFQANLKEIEMKQSESSEGIDGKDIDGAIDRVPDIPVKPV